MKLKYLSEILRPALFLTLFTICGLNAQIKTNNPDSLINIVLRAGENGLENGVCDQIISKLYNLEYNTAKNLASSLLEKSKVPSLQLFRGYMLVHSYRFFDYQQSIRNLTEAQKTAEKLKNTELLTAVYTFKSIVYRDNMISDSAMTYALMLRDILAESGKQVELLGNLQMIGDMHYYAGEFEEAEKMYRRVLDEQPGIKDNFNYRVLMNNLGLIRIKQKRYPEAEEFFMKSMEQLAAPGRNYADSSSLPYIYRKLMEIKILEKNYPAAEEYFVLGTGFAEKYSQRTELPGYLTGKAEILIAKKDFDSAFEVLSEAEKLNSEFPDYRNESQILRLYAELYSKTGKYQEANRYLLLHYTAERKIDSLVSRSKLLHLYAKHNYDAAFKHADNYRRERNFLIVIAALILLGLIVNSVYYYRSRITNRQLMEKNLRLAYVNESNNFANINSQDEKTGIDFIEINSDKSDSDKKIKEPGEDLLNRISALLEDLITKEKIYLEPNLTLVSLAQRLSTNRTYLLKAIQKKYNKNFVEFINGLRIKESIRIINSNERSLLSMDGIASKSGFSNRVTFTKVFRDITGVSPSYFMKNIDTLKHEMASERDEIK